MNNLLEGKQVLITGVGPNIGHQIALEMASQGAAIYFADCDEERCQLMQQELDKAGARGKGWVADMSDFASIDRLYSLINKENIRIDILVNNVGVNSWQGDIQEQSVENWQRVLNTNLVGPMHLTQLISQDMIKGGRSGSILFLSSIHQWFYKNDPMYSASKAAIGMLVNELAVKLGAYGIRVNSLAPGYVRLGDDGKPIPHQQTPLHNATIDPCYIGRAAVYLTSDYFSYCTTGTTLKIDAGLSLVNYIVPRPTAPPQSPYWVVRLGKRIVRKLKSV